MKTDIIQSSSSGVDGVTHLQEVLDNQPLFYAVVWACLYVFLEMLPDFRDGLIRQLLNSGDPISEGIGLAYLKVIG